MLTERPLLGRPSDSGPTWRAHQRRRLSERGLGDQMEWLDALTLLRQSRPSPAPCGAS